MTLAVMKAPNPLLTPCPTTDLEVGLGRKSRNHYQQAKGYLRSMSTNSRFRSYPCPFWVSASESPRLTSEDRDLVGGRQWDIWYATAEFPL